MPPGVVAVEHADTATAVASATAATIRLEMLPPPERANGYSTPKRLNST